MVTSLPGLMTSSSSPWMISALSSMCRIFRRRASWMPCRAVAVALSEEGAQVLVNDASSTGADEVARAITEAGRRAVANHDPVGSVTSAEAILRTALEAFGGVDVLVNNAGILRDRMIHNMSEQDWDDVITVHLKGTWACCRALIQHWRPLAKQEAREQRRTRKIINVTSASGLRGAAGQVNYAAAKMGVVGLTKTLAKEVGPLAINVNAVAPVARTAMTRGNDLGLFLPE